MELSRGVESGVDRFVLNIARNDFWVMITKKTCLYWNGAQLRSIEGQCFDLGTENQETSNKPPQKKSIAAHVHKTAVILDMASCHN